jgi:outer membrane protein insertion porin family
MKQKKKWFLSFITGAGKYKPEYEDMDIFAIKSLYMNAGYLDVTVADPLLDTTKPKKSRLIIRINEGKRYRINEITVSGVENFSNEELLRYIRVRKGEFAAYEAIESGREGIRAFYGNRGYVRTNVRPIFDADPDAGTVDIRYEVGEGAIGYISKVNIYGSERTKDKVIRRELVIYPGDKYTRARVKTS